MQHKLGLIVDMTSAVISVLSLLLMTIALAMIYWYLKKLQTVGKFAFNLPLFFLHLGIMLFDTTIRITGDVYKYKSSKPLDILTYEIEEAKLSIFFAVSTFVLQMSFVYLCWTFAGSKYQLKKT